MDSLLYTIVLTRGSFCTNENGRKVLLSALRGRSSKARISIIEPDTQATREIEIDLSQLITILKHDSGPNPAVLKRLFGERESVVSISNYIARRAGLSSVI